MSIAKFSGLLLATAVLSGTLPLSGLAATESAPEASAPLDKEAARAAEKQRRTEAAAERKRLADLRRQYGEGPYPDEINAYLADKPEPLKPLYRSLFVGGERNAVINFQRLGLAAMDQGLWDDAERAFDGALARIETVYAKNKQAEAARDTFRKEANKDFKGEPYERAMAYYYRGLLYLRDGDYDNARASFRTAEYQDTVSEAEEFQSDFAVMNYLVGWTYHCQGQPESATEAFGFAAATQPDLNAPAAGDRTLLLAEFGRAPIKARAAGQAQKMVFEPAGGSEETGARFVLDDTKVHNTLAASSVHTQATTRGGRAIDGILNGKAEFKATTGAVGSALAQTGMMSMLTGDTGGGLGMAGVGMLFSMFSSAAKIDADTRTWDTLPDSINIATAAPVGADTLAAAKVDYLNGEDTLKSTAPTMAAAAGSCAILWSRSRSDEDVAAAVPGDDAALAAQIARRKPVQLRDKAFRTALAGN